MSIKPILLILETKNNNYIHQEIRENYLNDCNFIIASAIYKFVTNSDLKIKLWNEVYQELKGKKIKDERSSEEIIKDTLKIFKNSYK